MTRFTRAGGNCRHILGSDFRGGYLQQGQTQRDNVTREKPADRTGRQSWCPPEETGDPIPAKCEESSRPTGFRGQVRKNGYIRERLPLARTSKLQQSEIAGY